MKNKDTEELEVVVYDYGKKVFETKGKKKKCLKELDLFKAKKLM